MSLLRDRFIEAAAEYIIESGDHDVFNVARVLEALNNVAGLNEPYARFLADFTPDSRRANNLLQAIAVKVVHHPRYIPTDLESKIRRLPEADVKLLVFVVEYAALYSSGRGKASIPGILQHILNADFPVDVRRTAQRWLAELQQMPAKRGR